ncbi:MAG TPA: alpha-L-fucosidase [Verrucomicrobiae bacterium]
MSRFRFVFSGVIAIGLQLSSPAAAAGPVAARDQWFRDAKFGLFMHWGLYSQLGNEWKGKSYYGSGEWIMNRAKIPVAEYEKAAREFNPTNFDAAGWARFARESGARYLVITAKHHEGFAMYDSKVSPFNIVEATPYGKDPMAGLASACRAEGIKFGFYYSQFLDWHEPNGGGNKWDFKEGDKDYARYYHEKSIPQIRELLSNYGPLGLMWFDMPGGLSRDETVAFMDEVRRLQPQCLISSRVGNGFGDFRDFGDSELPAVGTNGPWEALFTHNDSWGFVKGDLDFKTPLEILHLLAATAARGGNLLLNVGPDGTGKIPEQSLAYLREVGRWLAANGESIYGTTRSPFPDQPWGVATSKPGILYLHVFQPPADNSLVVPDFTAKIGRVALLNGKPLRAGRCGDDLRITLPAPLPDSRDSVAVVEYSGTLHDSWSNAPVTISRQFDSFSLDAARARLGGNAKSVSVTHSRYFGNWKHDTCIEKMLRPEDGAEFSVRVLEPGDYRVSLDYACAGASRGREGRVQFGRQTLDFETLLTGEYDNHQPLMLIRQSIGIVSIKNPGVIPLSVRPQSDGVELFWLRRVVLEPVR